MVDAVRPRACPRLRPGRIRLPVFLFFVFALCLLGEQEARAQLTSDEAAALPIVTSSATPDLSDGLSLEGAINAEEYVLGPGDEFAVTIGGSIARRINATVSADGTLAIPEIGS